MLCSCQPNARFLLTPLREGRRKEPKKPRPDLAISTHAPAGGATKRRQAMHGGYANFYSRPCGRGDEADVCGRNAVIISTHAPAGGATYKVSTRVLTVRCISTHAPAGGATRGEAGKKADWTISTHAPAGGATVMARWAAQPPKFLLTPLREGRRRGGTGMNGFLKISTHAPAGGATGAAPFLFSLLMQFLLTPLREGRRAAHPHRGPRRKISTHAPAGGATDDLQSRITTMNRISTHAPAGGATILHCRHARGGQNFYSRPCGRGDLRVVVIRSQLAHISTHAPAGGATRSRLCPRILMRLFLLTPLREGRPITSATPIRTRSHFYSRPCGRGDRFRPNGNGCRKLFLLTPLREGRHKGCRYRPDAESISTHAPAGGATEGGGKITDHAVLISTHAPAGGATASTSESQNINTKFLLTPLREGRHVGVLPLRWIYRISTHAPAGGATWRY